MAEVVRVRVSRVYEATVDELYPDGLPDAPPRGYGSWPADWTPARRAAFLLNHSF